jgi:hypothetical protein
MKNRSTQINDDTEKSEYEPPQFKLMMAEKAILSICLVTLCLMTVAVCREGVNDEDARRLKATLTEVRDAVEKYAEEHEGRYPSLAYFDIQITRRSDKSGKVCTSGDLGPYLQFIPPNPIDYKSQIRPVRDGQGGWFYDAEQGYFGSNDRTVRNPNARARRI